MPGRRLASFRSGDINEELGLFLLKAFALVSPVPRQEDVGLDAVATLLREDRRFLVAEDSFYVQLKSRSDREIIYAGHEADWLRALQLPFFIGSVNREQLELQLFAAHTASRVMIEAPYQKYVLHLDQYNTEPPHEEGVRHAYIGPPILVWTANDLNGDEFGQIAYRTLKAYSPVEHENLSLRGIRSLRPIGWTTNGEVKSSGQLQFSQTNDPNEIRRVCETMEHQLIKLFGDCWSRQSATDLARLAQFFDFLRERGYDPDPHHILETLQRALSAAPKSNS